MGSYLHPNMVKNANFRGFFENLRVFVYIALRYNSAAESTSLLSSVASLAIISNLDVILLCNIIDDIQNMIFSVVYRLLSYPISIFIKIHKLVYS